MATHQPWWVARALIAALAADSMLKRTAEGGRLRSVLGSSAATSLRPKKALKHWEGT